MLSVVMLNESKRDAFDRSNFVLEIMSGTLLDSAVWISLLECSFTGEMINGSGFSTLLCLLIDGNIKSACWPEDPS